MGMLKHEELFLAFDLIARTVYSHLDKYSRIGDLVPVAQRRVHIHIDPVTMNT